MGCDVQDLQDADGHVQHPGKCHHVPSSQSFDVDVNEGYSDIHEDGVYILGMVMVGEGCPTIPMMNSVSCML